MCQLHCVVSFSNCVNVKCSTTVSTSQVVLHLIVDHMYIILTSMGERVTSINPSLHHNLLTECSESNVQPIVSVGCRQVNTIFWHARLHLLYAENKENGCLLVD